MKDMIKLDPEAAWSRLMEITSEANDAALFWVADLAEDFLIKDGPTFSTRIEDEAARNPRFRRALLDLVPTAKDELINDRLLALRETIEAEYGLASDDADDT